MSVDCYSPEVVETLQALISPGNHSRLSPFVEAAQLQVLGHINVNTNRSGETTRVWLKEHVKSVRLWAEVLWGRRSTYGNDFASADYNDSDWLQAYLAYYFPFTVAKLQLLFLDLIRMRRLKGEVRLLDVGVGTGATFVAFLDFLVAWRQACRLHHVSIPVHSVEFLGIDRSIGCLESTKDILEAFGRAAGDTMLGELTNTLRSVQFQQVDLNQDSYSGQFRPTLVVAANVLNELVVVGASGEENLRQLLGRVDSGGVAIIVEPADEENGSRLSEWRASLLDADPYWRTLGPCAPEQAVGPGACKCWNFRKESLHESAVGKAVRMEIDKISKDPRGTRDLSNNLLKWSYMLMERSAVPIRPADDSDARVHLVDGAILSEPPELVFLGVFRKGPDGESREYLPLNPARDGKTAATDTAQEYVKTCPGLFANAEHVFMTRQLGYKLPPVPYGGKIAFRALKVTERRPQHYLLETSGDEAQGRVIEPIVKSGGFIETENYEEIESTIDQLANRMFGFQGLRSFQHRILKQVLGGKSILGIAATGGGKSECFILPAMILPGLTIVVSPLKSLMTDQYEQRIKERYGLQQLTTWFNGDISVSERMRRLQALERGFYKLAYFTPEQLERSYVLDSLERANAAVGVRYLAMDEAHCISQWGHDFRPSYLNILRRLKTRNIQPCVIALTATASPQVRDDICDELQLNPTLLQDGGNVYIDSSNRPELNLAVHAVENTDQKIAHMVETLGDLLRSNRHAKTRQSAAIVFMPQTGGDPDDVRQTTPRAGRLSAGVSRFASYLERELDCKVALYHGKMDNDIEDQVVPNEKQSVESKARGDVSGRDRRTEQMAFIKGNRDIMVATKGFGMGVDKPNIRLVLHRSPPGNLEAYAQEAGRAGRDGQPATAVLYYSPDKPKDAESYRPEQSDHEIQEYFLENKYIRPYDIRFMRAFLSSVRRCIDVRRPGLGETTRYLYFTNDEVIEFLNTCVSDASLAGAPFSWPAFSPRRRGSWESEEHTQILDRGHTYSERTGYIRRILAVLHKLRPNCDGERLVFIESCQDVKASVAPVSLRHWSALCKSNLYFGNIISQARMSGEEFTFLVNQPDLLNFAARLNMPLAEAVAMLNDIRSAETDRLIDYKNLRTPLYGPAHGKIGLAAWREYAGGLRRSAKAKKQAERENRRPELDEWFGVNELPRSVGWEVRLGSAMVSGPFEKYMKSFIELHDARKENDWRSYRYLITEYIGANPDGSLQARQAKRECLRSALLGYLKTGEVIVGGNCRSCSTCVPDERFEQYSLEDRRAVVARLRAETEKLLEKIASAATAEPPRNDLDDLFAMIDAEEKEGRSLLRYVTLWSARLIQDTAGHRGGTSFRFEAMCRGLLRFDETEFLAAIKTLSTGSGQDRSRSLMEEIDRNRERIRQLGEAHWLRANIAHTLTAYNEEESSLEAVVESAPNLERFREALDRQCWLHDSNGPRPNLPKFMAERVQRAWASESAWEAESRFADLIADWSWDNARRHFDRAMHMRAVSGAAGLLTAWIRARRGSFEELDAALDALDQAISEGASLQAESALAVLNSVGATSILNRTVLTSGIAKVVIHGDEASLLANESLPFAIELLLRGTDLRPPAIKRIALSLAAADIRGTSRHALLSQFCARLAAFRRACSSLQQPDSKDFASLWSTFAHGPDTHTDMLVQATRGLRRKCRNERWKTPASREFQALAKARRYTEAEELATQILDLEVKNEPAVAFLERARLSGAERTPEAELIRTYDKLAEVLL